jgi:hypothetical protein
LRARCEGCTAALPVRRGSLQSVIVKVVIQCLKGRALMWKVLADEQTGGDHEDQTLREPEDGEYLQEETSHS